MSGTPDGGEPGRDAPPAGVDADGRVAPPLAGAPVLVVGAGIMGAGIAQVAALAGHRVWLHDARGGAAAAARGRLGTTLDGLVAKGRLSAQAAADALGRIEPAARLADAAGARLAVEAIVEDLEAKRGLFGELESLLADDAVLATNTSSLSVTAIGAGLRRPGRLVGMHFFNPVPLMKLVEVVSGLQTEPAVADAIHALARAWGKTPVHARSTPGFIVNRIARPYYAEALALLLERAGTPAAIDACLKAAGFRMGPCELMDLIGHDTNFAVTRSVYDAYFQDKRYAPSPLQREMVDGGLLGRKSGRGFYAYGTGAPGPQAATAPAPASAPVSAPPPTPLPAEAAAAREITVHGRGPSADALAQRAAAALAPHAGGTVRRTHDGDWTGLSAGSARLVLTDGRTAQAVAEATGCADVAVFDRLPAVAASSPGAALAYAVAPQAGAAWRAQAPAWLAALGFAPVEMADAPGLVVARTLAMLVNEAADAVLQGVCDEAGADAAMKLGVNYPAGPFEWLAGWDARGVAAVVRALDAEYRGERYRVSPWLRRRAGAGADGTAPPPHPG